MSAALVCVLPMLAGCGAAAGTTQAATSALSITPGVSSLDTNCTGCNGVNRRGEPVHKFAALTSNGATAQVTWSVSGGDRVAGPGTIDAAGRYTPPSYLTADHAEVTITAHLEDASGLTASAPVTIRPGFLQPLTPENAAVGPGGTVTIAGKLAVAGGQTVIHFALAATAQGGGNGAGTLSAPICDRSEKAFTTCTVTYTAPATITGSSAVYVVATASGAGGKASRTETELLLNSAGVSSNPMAHQELQPSLMSLGNSGGNNSDYDAHGNTIADCCSGTLGALVQDNTGRQYVLSNNHVLAKSDHATVGDAIVQPGLIDNNCTPNGVGPGTLPVANLTLWVPLKSAQTNVDAAIAQTASRTIESGGNILELGTRQADGSLAAAPPGISSTSGRGEAAGLRMRVAKSGRTTGLTCGGVSAIDLDVAVDYFSDCAETRPYTTKVFTNQLGISGDRFSDAGDSGALVVNAANAEPVGLFFAGGTDAAGVGHGVANPAGDVLNALSSASGNGMSFTFVGGADHAVSCLNYGNSTVRTAQELALSDAETTRGQQALFAARSLVNPAAGILGVSMGKSTDHAGEAAVLVYVGEHLKAAVPATIEGARTVVIPATSEEVALGTAAVDNGAAAEIPLAGDVLERAIRLKQQVARRLMLREKAFFGVGVGQSLDNPRDAALVVYVDRNHVPASLPQTIEGVRTRYVIMDRLHVTRSYATQVQSTRHCLAPEALDTAPLLPLSRQIDLP
ncbi:S1 family peptidase [Occallatibacter riparius]|uniref:S1 family peptidase n=1 Tax=Occallatibacter riparius TaxID=1002689 RepID=A0A9J7BT93_9BACT|nr:S1 family peptidase [Occallatibacter riparius]UWZ84118.1 S1 family peptidase [Occallatibacter riparius]